MIALAGLGALVFLFLLGPLTVLLASALGTTSYLAFPPHGLTSRWLLSALGDPAITSAFWTSLELAALVVPCSLLLGVPAAYALARGAFPGRDLLEAALLLPLVLPAIVLSVSVTLLVSRVGLPASLPRLAASHLVICVPWVVRVLLPVLRNMDPRIEMAARSLGAGTVATLLHVTIPIVRPGIVVATALCALVSFDEFELSFFLAPPQRPTLPVVLFARAEYGIGAAIGAVAALLIGFALLCAAACLLMAWRSGRRP